MAVLMLKSEDNFHDDEEEDEAVDEWLFLELMILTTLSLLSLSVVFVFVSSFTAAVAAPTLLFLLLACREIKGCSSEEAEAEASPCWLLLPAAAMVIFLLSFLLL